MKNRLNFWIVLIYALCLGVFGFIGFHRTGSLMSLYSGLIFALLLLISCFAMHKNRNWGLGMAIILTTFLTILFGIRSVVTHKIVPIIIALVSAVVLYFIARKPTAKNKNR